MISSLAPQRSLAERAAEDLRRAIRSGDLAIDGQLPSEPALAKLLGVSRGTVRHAVSILEEEGLVNRRQGLGTFVVRRVLELRDSLNVNVGLTDMIRSSGREPGVRDLVVGRWSADQAVAKELDVAPGEAVLRIERTRTADGKPVAHTTDYLPGSVLNRLGFGEERLRELLEREQSLYQVLKDAGVVIHHAVAEISPSTARPELAARLGISATTLLLRLDQVDYTPDGQALLFSEEHLVAERLSILVYRKGPGG